MDLPEKVSKCFFELFDCFTLYVQELTCECVCHTWSSIHSSIDWAPNEVVESNIMVHDWRGRVTTMNHLQSVRYEANDHINVIASLLLKCYCQALPIIEIACTILY